MADTPAPEDVDTAEFDPAAIVAEAKKTFSLSDRIQGKLKLRNVKVPVFLDLEAVDEYNAANSRAQEFADAAALLSPKPGDPPLDEAQEQRRKNLMGKFEAMEDSLEKLRQRMLEGALVFHLRSYPGVALEIARRRVRKAYADPSTGLIPTENIETAANVREIMDRYLFGQTVQRIVDPTGAEADLSVREEVLNEIVDGKKKKRKVKIDPRDTLYDEMKTKLPPTQWGRLFDEYQRITLSDEIAQTAIDDPDF